MTAWLRCVGSYGRTLESMIAKYVCSYKRTFDNRPPLVTLEELHDNMVALMEKINSAYTDFFASGQSGLPRVLIPGRRSCSADSKAVGSGSCQLDNSLAPRNLVVVSMMPSPNEPVWFWESKGLPTPWSATAPSSSALNELQR
jgi:hypothetical protein